MSYSELNPVIPRLDRGIHSGNRVLPRFSRSDRHEVILMKCRNDLTSEGLAMNSRRRVRIAHHEQGFNLRVLCTVCTLRVFLMFVTTVFTLPRLRRVLAK